MFAQKNRLTKKKDIDSVFKSGRYSFAKDLGIKYLKNNLDHPRFAVIVSNQVSKKATERNQIKRRLREIVRLARPQLPQNLDLIVLTRPSVKQLDYAEMQNQLSFCFKKARLIIY